MQERKEMYAVRNRKNHIKLMYGKKKSKKSKKSEKSEKSEKRKEENLISIMRVQLRR